MKIIPLRPALFPSGLTEDQTSAASDRDPLDNPEIRTLTFTIAKNNCHLRIYSTKVREGW